MTYLLAILAYLAALALIVAFLRGVSRIRERMDRSEEIDTVTGRRG